MKYHVARHFKAKSESDLPGENNLEKKGEKKRVRNMEKEKGEKKSEKGGKGRKNYMKGEKEL